MAEMKIQEAISKFQKEGDSAVYKGFRDAVDAIVKSGTSEPIKNDCYPDALYLTQLMFERSNKQISILTGPGIDRFLEALMGSFEGALTRIKSVAGMVRIILLDDTIPSTLKELQNKFAGTLDIRLAKSKDEIKVSHLTICDSSMVRIEDPHEPIDAESTIDNIHANVYYNNPGEAVLRQTYYDAIWKILNQGAPVRK